VTAATVRVQVTTRPGTDLLASLRRRVTGAFADDGFDETDWQHALGGHHVGAVLAGEDVGHAAVVPRTLHVGGRPRSTGYVEAVAVAPSQQGRGIGSRVMDAVADVVRDRYELGALSTGRWSFYARLGWQRWQGPTAVLRQGRAVPTPDDDDGVMVLRTPATEALDLTALLACDDREGDVW